MNFARGSHDMAVHIPAIGIGTLSILSRLNNGLQTSVTQAFLGSYVNLIVVSFVTVQLWKFPNVHDVEADKCNTEHVEGCSQLTQASWQAAS